MTPRDIHTHLDLSFEWTELHRTAEQLRPLTFSYDKLADDCIAKLNELSPPEKYRPKAGEPPRKAPKRDLLALLEKHAKDDAKLEELWTEVNTVPDWVDWDQIQRGQEVFYRYGMPIMNVVCTVAIDIGALLMSIAQLPKPIRWDVGVNPTWPMAGEILTHL
jgi:hypothetical protein